MVSSLSSNKSVMSWSVCCDFISRDDYRRRGSSSLVIFRTVVKDHFVYIPSKYSFTSALTNVCAAKGKIPSG